MFSDTVIPTGPEGRPGQSERNREGWSQSPGSGASGRRGPDQTRARTRRQKGRGRQKEPRPSWLAAKGVFTGTVTLAPERMPSQPWPRCEVRETKVSKRGPGLNWSI